MDLDRARATFLSTQAPYAPAVFAEAGQHRTLRARLSAASDLLAQLGPAARPAEASLAERVLSRKERPRDVLKELHAAGMPRAASDPSARAAFGLNHEHFTGWSRLPQARVAACMAADLIWFFYAEGVVLARDAAPVGSLRTDMYALASATNAFAVADYPAVAVAFGAALHTDEGPPGRWHSYAALVRLLVERHIGGPFAAQSDRIRVGGASDRIAEQAVRRLAKGGVPPFFTTARLTGLMVHEIDEAVPHLDLAASDEVGNFEEAANRLVFDTLKAGSIDPEVLRALDELLRALQVEV